MKFLVLLATLLVLSAPGFSTTVFVPDDYATIQGAIDASVSGDTVIVRPGTYSGGIDFSGKDISLQSEQGPEVTIIDGGMDVVQFRSGEGPNAVIDGFTVTGGWGTNGVGIVCSHSSPTITNNIIRDNFAAHSGAGVACYWASPTITHNIIRGNTAYYGSGGGIFCLDSSAEIVGNTIVDNRAATGGGIYCGLSSLDIENNIISGNVADSDRGGGIFLELSVSILTNNIIVRNRSEIDGGGIQSIRSSLKIDDTTICDNTALESGGGLCFICLSSASIRNTILWNNTALQGPEFELEGTSSAAISYSDVEGGQTSCHVDPTCAFDWGDGMIDADPLFVDAAQGDYHITRNSPCLNTAYNSYHGMLQCIDFEGDPRPGGDGVDMGADEFYYHLYHRGDVVPGGTIDIRVIGYPLAPVFLGWGNETYPGKLTQHGWLRLQSDFWYGFIGTVSQEGVLTLPVTVSATWNPGDSASLQALVGPWGGKWTQLTNLDIITVE